MPSSNPTQPRSPMTTRVDVQMFAGDLLAQRDAVVYEHYQGTDDRGSLRLDPGDGVKLAITGDRSSIRLLISAALTQLAPPNPNTAGAGEPDTGEPQSP